MSAAAKAEAGAEETNNLFALLPHEVAAHILMRAGGPSALQSTRSTSQAWRAALDGLTVKASCACPSPPCAVLAQLPHLATVDLSSCCEPAPAGALAGVLLQLAALKSLRTLQLSTWLMAQPQEEAPAQQTLSLSAAASGHMQHSPAAAGAAQQTSSASNAPSASGQHSAVAAGFQASPSSATATSEAAATAQQTACRSPPAYDITLPSEVAAIENLRELIITTCAEVSTPPAKRLQLPPALMRMPNLSRLALHGFLPAVHHLRGLRHLQHLSLSDSQHNAEVLKAATAAVLSLPRLTSLHVQLPAPQAGSSFPGLVVSETIMQGLASVQLLEALCTAAAEEVTAATAAGAAAEQPADNPSSSSTGRSAGAALEPSLPAAAAAGAATAAAARLRLAAPCKLRSIRLRAGAGLYHLPSKFAAACAGLQELHLPCSRLTGEAAARLGRMTGLTSLCLADSRLAELPSSWAGLTKLQVLDMCGNPLGGLPPFFSRMQAMRKLLLASTHMLLLPAAVSSLTGLEHLNLSSNKLQELPAELCSCTGLSHLDVSKNRLLSLPEQFSNLSRITQLSLTGNHLESLPSGLQGLRCLSHLGLALNYYKAWTHAVPCFAGLASTLQELEVQHTATVLDDAAGFLAAIGQLTALTSLAAGSNQLSDLPAAWQQLKRLKVLQLSHNAMEVTPIGLLSLTALTYLDLSYNRLVSLPFWIGSSKLQQLQRLNLAKNHLTTLPAEMSGLARLTQLQLQGNNLASVPPCLAALQRLRLLNIGGNYKLKEAGLGGQLAGLGSLRDVVLPYRLDKAAGELRAAGKSVVLDSS